MNDETTTDVEVQDVQAHDAQPVEQQTEAVIDDDSEQQTTEQSDTGEVEPDETDNSTEDKTFTNEWLASKGIDLSAPDAAQKLANMAFNSEKVMSKTTQKASELEKIVQSSTAMTDAPISKTDLLVGAMLFKQNNPLSPDQDTKMGEYLSTNPEKMALMQYGYLSYEDIYHMSGAASLNAPDAATLKKKGSEEALRQLANKQRATAPSGSATTNKAPEPGDPISEALLGD